MNKIIVNVVMLNLLTVFGFREQAAECKRQRKYY